jgi:hypothetical protein
MYSNHIQIFHSRAYAMSLYMKGHLRTSPSHRETGTANLQELNTLTFFFVQSTGRELGARTAVVFMTGMTQISRLAAPALQKTVLQITGGTKGKALALKFPL